MDGKTVIGLEITDLNPSLEWFGEAHVAYCETVEEALGIAKEYMRYPGEYKLRLVWERRTAEGWEVVEYAEVA